jgi:putative glutamine amidotransferase
MNKIIGIVASNLGLKDKITKDRSVPCGTRETYINALQRVGATVIIISPTNSGEVINQQVALCDGILMQGGGGDITANNLEVEYIKEAVKQNKSLLGICLGMQLINVACGGKIDFIITGVNHAQTSPLSEDFHSINIKQNTILHKMFGDRTMVNSSHVHHITTLADNLEVMAKSEDEVIEAIRATDKKFMVGVQWHPERMLLKNNKMLALFEEFLKNC